VRDTNSDIKGGRGSRESALRRTIQELTIQIDEAKRARPVAEITDTDHFRDLQRRARDLR